MIVLSDCRSTIVLNRDWQVLISHRHQEESVSIFKEIKQIQILLSIHGWLSATWTGAYHKSHKQEDQAD